MYIKENTLIKENTFIKPGLFVGKENKKLGYKITNKK